MGCGPGFYLQEGYSIHQLVRYGKEAWDVVTIPFCECCSRVRFYSAPLPKTREELAKKNCTLCGGTGIEAIPIADLDLTVLQEVTLNG